MRADPRCRRRRCGRRRVDRQSGRRGRAFPGVRLIRQANRGLAAARNAGLAALDTSYVVFLDADDRLESRAIEAGLACFARAPDSGFVYGGHRYIDADGREIGERFESPGDAPYLHLLRRNFIAMHGTVMYRRDLLAASGGFDEQLRQCEDYDVYLRMARRYPVAGYADLVAAYRLHGDNMSADHRAMLRSALEVHARHAPSPADGGSAAEAWAAGRRAWRRIYAEEMVAARYRSRQNGGGLTASLPVLASIAAVAPRVALLQVVGGIRRRIAPILPRRLRERLLRGRERVPPVGRVRFGRSAPVDPDQPLLSDSIAGCRSIATTSSGSLHATRPRSSAACSKSVTTATRGGSAAHGCRAVTCCTFTTATPRATYVGDLTDPDVLPENAFDCIVLTQTLQLIYDVAARDPARLPCARARRRRPGHGSRHQPDRPRRMGQNLVLVLHPGGAATTVWRSVSVPTHVMVERYGNVFSATAFLQGLAVEELETSDLDPVDEAYPVIVALRARKRQA